jgi:hypothetical protein
MASIQDSQDRLLASSALARATSAGGDMVAFRERLDKCFTLGEELFKENGIAHPGRPTYDDPAYYVLADLVRHGISVDPATTSSLVEGIQNTALKAFLLEDLATALYAD